MQPESTYRGTSIEAFVAARRAFLPPMSDKDYNDHIAKLSDQMEEAIGTQLDLNRSLILDLFPIGVRTVLRLSWVCMTRIGEVIAMALVGLVLAYLASRTIEEVAEMITKYKNRSTNTNPFPVGVVKPK